jgi:hypothetical protein
MPRYYILESKNSLKKVAYEKFAAENMVSDNPGRDSYRSYFNPRGSKGKSF